jgi:uncharacterized protein
MKLLLTIFITAVVTFFAGWFSYAYTHRTPAEDVVKETKQVITKPLEKYSIENLKNATWQPGTFTIEKELADEKEYKSWLFSYEFNPEVEGNTRKKVTGQINIPKEGGPFPLVLMFRGYVDQTMYSTGTGTRPAAKYFAENGYIKNGYITIAPDFLGYGGSDKESSNVFETRLQTYTTASSIIKSLNETSFTKTAADKWDRKNIFIWSHSNGGQIALTSLEITGVNYPTTLWAPASKAFPYVVLYYTDESNDGGKFIRRELSKFEELYDVEKYSYTNYLDSIQAPLLLHQGGADDAVPIAWSNDLAGKLKKKEKDIVYYIYPGSDHNLRPSWEAVIERDTDFFKKHIK